VGIDDAGATAAAAVVMVCVQYFKGEGRLSNKHANSRCLQRHRQQVKAFQLGRAVHVLRNVGGFVDA
jgi:hypothetical protein